MSAPTLSLQVCTGDPAHAPSWLRIATVQQRGRYGSISDRTAGGRDVYLFGFDHDGAALVVRCALGLDVSRGSLRKVAADPRRGLRGAGTVVATLDQPGQVWERTVLIDSSAAPRRIRVVRHD